VLVSEILCYPISSRNVVPYDTPFAHPCQTILEVAIWLETQAEAVAVDEEREQRYAKLYPWCK
jgi:hypothetical protein